MNAELVRADLRHEDEGLGAPTASALQCRSWHWRKQVTHICQTILASGNWLWWSPLIPAHPSFPCFLCFCELWFLFLPKLTHLIAASKNRIVQQWFGFISLAFAFKDLFLQWFNIKYETEKRLLMGSLVNVHGLCLTRLPFPRLLLMYSLIPVNRQKHDLNGTKLGISPSSHVTVMGRKGRCMTQALTIRLESVIFFFIIIKRNCWERQGAGKKGCREWSEDEADAVNSHTYVSLLKDGPQDVRFACAHTDLKEPGNLHSPRSSPELVTGGHLLTWTVLRGDGSHLQSPTERWAKVTFCWA